MKELADLCKALSDETRLAMLALLLRHGELCVCDLVAVLGITQSKASRHLRYLLHAGLVRDRRAGVWVYYRVPPDPQPAPGEVLRLVGPLLAARGLSDLETRLAAWQAAHGGRAACCAPAVPVRGPVRTPSRKRGAP